MFRRLFCKTPACYRIASNGHYLKLTLPRGRQDLNEATLERDSLIQVTGLPGGRLESSQVPYHQAIAHLQEDQYQQSVEEIASWVREDLTRQLSWKSRFCSKTVERVLNNGRVVQITAPYGFHDVESIRFRSELHMVDSETPTLQDFGYTTAMTFWNQSGQSAIRNEVAQYICEKQRESLALAYPSTSERLAVVVMWGLIGACGLSMGCTAWTVWKEW